MPEVRGYQIINTSVKSTTAFSNFTHSSLQWNRVDKNRDFLNKNQKIDFFDLNRIFFI